MLEIRMALLIDIKRLFETLSEWKGELGSSRLGVTSITDILQGRGGTGLGCEELLRSASRGPSSPVAWLQNDQLCR